MLTGRGVEQSSQGTATVTAAIDLALALGLPGRVGSGYGAITGQGNGQGGREHGQKADQLPGYRRIDDPAARAHVAAVWGVDPATLPGPGMPAVELLRSLGARPGPGGATTTYAEDGRPRALLVRVERRGQRAGRGPGRPTCARSTCSWCATSCRRRRRCSRTSCCP